METSRDVASEVREIDVFFTPTLTLTSAAESYRDKLGLLGQLATTKAIFEPFRNPVTKKQIRSCASKLFNIHAELERQFKREKQQLKETELPRLWIITPTASSELLKDFDLQPVVSNLEMSGVYQAGDGWKTGLVVIHQLACTPETLWLRILGKKGQKAAIEELRALAADHPCRTQTLELLYNLQANLAVNQKLAKADQELVMALAPLYRQQIDAAIQQGKLEGIQQGKLEGIQQGKLEGIQQGKLEGIQQGQHLIVENLLKVRFGELSERLTILVEPITALPPEELTWLLLQLAQLEGNSEGRQQAERLIIEKLIRSRLGELEEQASGMAESFLALPQQELALLLSQLTELQPEEFLARWRPK